MFRQEDATYARNRWGLSAGRWYRFDGEGRMLTGWHFDPVYSAWFYFDGSGAMVTGWREIDGTWYYFNPEPDGTRGTMAADRIIDGWYVDKNGIWDGKPRRGDFP